MLVGVVPRHLDRDLRLPIERAAPIALGTARAAAEAAGGEWRLVFVLFSAGDLEVYRAAL